MTKASDNQFPKLLTVVQATDPSAPSNGDWTLYSKAAGIYARSSNTVVGPFAAASNSGGSAGGLVFLEQHTASASATLDFTTFISATYDEYQIEFVGIIPATGSVALWMRMGTGGGPTYDSGTNYGWSAFVTRAGASAVSGAESGATKIQVGYSADIVNTATKGLSGSFRLYEPQSTARHKQVLGQVTNFDASSFNVLSQCNGIYISTTAVTAVQFLMSSGNIASGTVRVYGIAKS